MFLQTLQERNPSLIEVAVEFHQRGWLPPNTIVLDADAIELNVSILRRAAEDSGVHLYFMLKQIRNPQVLDVILRNDRRNETVCVDTDDARLLWETGHGLGHVGHLVQIPTHQIGEILRMQPEVVTVFSVEKALQVDAAARSLGLSQSILLRVAGPDDVRFPSMEGGIAEEELEPAAEALRRLENVEVVGVTSFPAMSYTELGEPTPTPNLATSIRCAGKLQEMGFNITQVNAPGNTCSLSIPVYAKAGATHVEPGHGLTGTTPFTLHHELPEIPGMIYISEVLHQWRGLSYVHGGGFYWEDQMILGADYRNRVLVGRDQSSLGEGSAIFAGCAPEGQSILIDYYGVLEQGSKPEIRIGDTAVFGFRTQAFATRSAHTAVLRGVNSKHPVLLGVYDRCGHRARCWP